MLRATRLEMVENVGHGLFGKELRNEHSGSNQGNLRGTHHRSRPAALNCLLSGCSRTGDRGRTTRAPSSVLLGRGPWKVDAGNFHPRKLADADDAASFVISGEAGRSLSSTAKAAICGYRPEGTAHSWPPERRAYRRAHCFCMDAGSVHNLRRPRWKSS